MPAMNPSDEKLSAALRGVAAASRQGASSELGAKLKAEFNRHHAHRRKIRRIQVGSVAICLSAFVMLLLAGMRLKHPGEMRANKPSMPFPVAATGTALPKTLKPVVVRPASLRTAAKKKTRRTDDFMMLPSYDPAPVGDDLRIVRVELTGASLRLLGAPVTEEASDQRMQADVVLGNDGTPYAVRLVNGH